ncbi:MAG: type II toxin-antitoxin system VapC family toxin [Actinomycetota bacterium]
MVERHPCAVYFDTSALLKLYVQERWTEEAERAAEEAEVVLVSEISYLEARASFARMREDGALESDGDLRRVVERFEEDWPGFLASPVGGDLLRAAGALAEKHRRKRLRSYDALHLASALDAFGLFRAPEEGGPEWRTLFLAFDRNLVKASRGEVGLYFDPFAEQPAAGEEGGGEPADVDGET